VTRIFLLTALLVLAAPSKQPHTALPQHAWLSIPRLGFRARVALHTLPHGTQLANLITPWLWTMQSPRPREQPIPFPGDEIDLQRSRGNFRARARFYTQRVLTTSRDDRHWLRQQYAHPTLIVRHCAKKQCTIVIAQRK
jgi:hypothetical protein